MDSSRIGAAAGVAFVLIGAVELALTGGPAPGYARALERAGFFADTSASGPVVAILSGVAGASFLVFAASLRRRCTHRLLADLAGGSAIALLVLAWAGQALQQAAWRVSGSVEGELVGALGVVASLLFAFALLAGGVLATSVALEAWRAPSLPGWLTPLGLVAAAVVLAGVAVPLAATAAFPAFLVWLLAASAALARRVTPSTAGDVDRAHTG